MFEDLEISGASAQPAPHHHSEAVAASGIRATKVRRKILIVEDELWSALDMEWVIAKLGHDTVGTAASTESALRMAERFAPSLILMDIRLAYNGDGITAATEIRQRFNIPSIFVSAHADAKTRERARSALAADFIEKPFTPETLAVAIQNALGIED